MLAKLPAHQISKGIAAPLQNEEAKRQGKTIINGIKIAKIGQHTYGQTNINNTQKLIGQSIKLAAGIFEQFYQKQQHKNGDYMVIPTMRYIASNNKYKHNIDDTTSYYT